MFSRQLAKAPQISNLDMMAEGFLDDRSLQVVEHDAREGERADAGGSWLLRRKGRPNSNEVGAEVGASPYARKKGRVSKSWHQRRVGTDNVPAQSGDVRSEDNNDNESDFREQILNKHVGDFQPPQPKLSTFAQSARFHSSDDWWLELGETLTSQASVALGGRVRDAFLPITSVEASGYAPADSPADNDGAQDSVGASRDAAEKRSFLGVSGLQSYLSELTLVDVEAALQPRLVAALRSAESLASEALGERRVDTFSSPRKVPVMDLIPLAKAELNRLGKRSFTQDELLQTAFSLDVDVSYDLTQLRHALFVSGVGARDSNGAYSRTDKNSNSLIESLSDILLVHERDEVLPVDVLQLALYGRIRVARQHFGILLALREWAFRRLRPPPRLRYAARALSDPAQSYDFLRLVHIEWQDITWTSTPQLAGRASRVSALSRERHELLYRMRVRAGMEHAPNPLLSTEYYL